MHVFCTVVWIGAFLISGTHRTTADGSPKPNIILLLADDLGYGDLGCYGNEKSTTPNIDGLARDGLRFIRMYSEPGDTSARAAILTARYPVRYGLVMDRKALPILRSPDFHSVAQPGGLNGISGPLLPSMLKSLGYRQAMIGKWHLGVGQDGEHLPLNLGFDLFYGTPMSHGPSCSENDDDHRITDLHMLFSFFRRLVPVVIALFVMRYFGLVRKSLATGLFIINCAALILYGSYLTFAIFNPKSCILMENNSIVEQPYQVPNMTTRMTKRALEFVSSSAEDKQPFFLFMSYLQTHHPPFVSPSFRNRSGHGLYYDSLMELDWSVGVIVKKLKSLNIYKNTIIIFTSDNGAEWTNPLTKAQYPDHLRGSFRFHTGHSYDVVTLKGEKQSVWEGGIRVPAIITWPDVIESDQQTSKIASLLDLFPTVREILLPGHPPKDVDGQNLLPTLKNTNSPATRRFLMHYCDTEGVSAVTANRYKVHFRSCSGEVFNPPLLYDIEKDPGESSPLALSDHEKLVTEVRSAVDLHKSKLTAVPSQFAQVLRPWLYLCENPPFCKKQMPESENFGDLLI